MLTCIPTDSCNSKARILSLRTLGHWWCHGPKEVWLDVVLGMSGCDRVEGIKQDAGCAKFPWCDLGGAD